MTDITPKQLKKLAERVGYKAFIEDGYCNIWKRVKFGNVAPILAYIPWKNAEQAWELVKKFSIMVGPIEDDRWMAATTDTDSSGIGAAGRSSDPQEAVTLAAIAYMESE